MQNDVFAVVIVKVSAVHKFITPLGYFWHGVNVKLSI